MSVEGLVAMVVCAALVAVPLFAAALPTEHELPLGAMVHADLQLDSADAATLLVAARALVDRLTVDGETLALGSTDDLARWVAAALSLEQAETHRGAPLTGQAARDIIVAYYAIFRFGQSYERQLQPRLVQERVVAATAPGTAARMRAEAVSHTLATASEFGRERLGERLEIYLSTHPDDASIREMYADWLFSNGDLEGTRSALERVIAKAGTPDRRLKLASILIALGARDQGEAVLALVVRAQPAFGRLVPAAREAGLRLHERRALERGGGLTERPQDAARHAQLLYETGEVSRASDVWAGLVEQFPTDRAILLGAAQHFAQVQDFVRWERANERGTVAGMEGAEWLAQRIVGGYAQQYLALLAASPDATPPSLIAPIREDLRRLGAIAPVDARLVEHVVAAVELVFDARRASAAAGVAERLRPMADRFVAAAPDDLRAHIAGTLVLLMLDAGDAAVLAARAAVTGAAPTALNRARLFAASVLFGLGVRRGDGALLDEAARWLVPIEALGDARPATGVVPGGDFDRVAAAYYGVLLRWARALLGDTPAAVQKAQAAASPHLVRFAESVAPETDSDRRALHSACYNLAVYYLENRNVHAAAPWVRKARRLMPSDSASELVGALLRLAEDAPGPAFELFAGALTRATKPSLAIAAHLGLATLAARIPEPTVATQHRRAALSLLDSVLADRPAGAAATAEGLLGGFDMGLSLGADGAIAFHFEVEPRLFVLPASTFDRVAIAATLDLPPAAPLEH